MSTSLTAADFTVGEKVRFAANTVWYPGEVIKVGAATITVRYVKGSGQTYEMAVNPTKPFPAGGKLGTVPSRVAKADGTSQPAETATKPAATKPQGSLTAGAGPEAATPIPAPKGAIAVAVLTKPVARDALTLAAGNAGIAEVQVGDGWLIVPPGSAQSLVDGISAHMRAIVKADRSANMYREGLLRKVRTAIVDACGGSVTVTRQASTKPTATSGGKRTQVQAINTARAVQKDPQFPAFKAEVDVKAMKAAEIVEAFASWKSGRPEARKAG